MTFDRFQEEELEVFLQEQRDKKADANFWRCDDAEGGPAPRMLLLADEFLEKELREVFKSVFRMRCCSFPDIVIDHWAADWISNPHMAPAVALIRVLMDKGPYDSCKLISYLRETFPYMRIAGLCLLEDGSDAKHAVRSGAEYIFSLICLRPTLANRILRWLGMSELEER